MHLRKVWIFIGKFVLVAPPIWILWWSILPGYAWLVGQISGTAIQLFSSAPVEAMRIVTNEDLFLNAGTSIVFTSDGAEYPFDIASLVGNLPTLIVLLLATPGIKVPRLVRGIGIGTMVLALAHVGFVAGAFVLRNEIQSTPEIPTALGYVLLTLPFALWIVLTQAVGVGTDQADSPATNDS
ncbi:MAG: hypothetical protein VCD00_09665 [Candidatus Hydrogenedentota bacterium]